MRRIRRSCAAVCAALVLGGLVLPSASRASPPLPLVGGLLEGRIVSAESFRGQDGHLYTEAAVQGLLGTTRVVGRGGRVGQEWEAVEHEPTLVPGALVSLETERISGLLRVAGGESSAGDGGVSGAGSADAHPASGAGFTAAESGWCYRRLPARYVVETPVGATWIAAVQRGFQSWSVQPTSWMSFAYAGGTDSQATGNDGVNRVFFRPSSDTFLGRAYVYGAGSQIVGFDIWINTRYGITTGGSGFDLETIVRHEAGHALGLGHSQGRGNVMYPTIGWQEERGLGRGDRAGNRTLYPFNDVAVRVMERDPNGTVRMLPGGRAMVAVKLLNSGRTPWNGPFRNIEIRTDGPRNRHSPFFDSPTWISRSEPGAPISGVVCHEEMATVRWAMKAPQKIDSYREAFAVRIGDGWMTDQSPVWTVAVPI